MGTAMYVHVEKRVNGKWQYVPPSNAEGTIWDSWYDESSYDTMAVLAGVRNVEGYESISVYRDLPSGMSAELQGMVDISDGYLSFDHSWVLLSEIDAYDFEQTIIIYARSESERGPVMMPVLVTVRDMVDDLFRLVEKIRLSLPGVCPEDIRLTMFFK